MGGQWILKKSHLAFWLRQMRKEMDLIAPVRQGEDIIFKSMDYIHLIALDCPALVPSPKEFLFPQFEPMMRRTGEGLADLADERKRVIFGVRSCDVSAVGILDRFFLEGFRDPYYAARRENTLFISVVCGVPDPTCFCAGHGTGPFLREGFDIQLYDLGDRYLVQAGSAKAQKLVSNYSFLMKRPVRADFEDQYEIELSSQAMFKKRISLDAARKMIIEGKVPDEFWRRVTERCFECGGCVYDCPLCTCFTVIDRKFGGEVERSRLWDTCFFKGFTSMAGGVLPAEDRIKRTKRWFYHKLVHYPDTLGAFGCVGCGRCAVACPGKIDMATVVSWMKKG
jgi:ferredoxin